ncbi:cadherin-like beta sandwich domain-containing protein [Anaeromicropila herbilytica]|uniref:Cadherin-like beta-sandwich-like domain-containing protein n=1 Tax=Anaeromicropila herbilytica TaxID=2785025 RepID=A0A7R7IBQ4_9FIRM|nr:cadherin-like beta sandwich domain-containing protein [Anaeromicropila herbilytica]BCN29842.1 hypothetical protein bsdtb5_11370 [Anaeromicropila herbilytica]
MERVKEKCNNLIIIGILIFMLSFFSTSTICLAASASINFTTKNTTVIVGDKVTISLVVNSSSNIGDFEAYIAYDPSVLEFTDGGSFVNGDDGILKVSDTNNVDGTTKKKYVLTFKAKDTGATEIRISDKAVVFNSDDGNEMSVSSSPLSINVIAQKETSTNNILKSLKISPGKLSPQFDKNTNKYTVSVDNSTKNLIISAIPEDNKAKVTVKNATNLSEGDNQVIITVKVESGDKKDYTITVTREKSTTSGDDKDKNNTTDAGNGNDTFPKLSNEINAENVNGEIYVGTNSAYKVVGMPENETVPEGYINTKIKINNVSITAYTLENDLENEFLLLYLMNKDGVSGFYQYDRIEKTLQRYNLNEDKVNHENTKDKHVTQSDKNLDKLNQMYLITAILIGINLITISVIIRLYRKRK